MKNLFLKINAIQFISISILLILISNAGNGQTNLRQSQTINPDALTFQKSPCPVIYFDTIGDLSGDCIMSLPTDISADGKRVVLSSSADEPGILNDGGTCDPYTGWQHSNEAAGWTRPCKNIPFFKNYTNGGLVGFGYLQGGNPAHDESFATGISPDGKVVVGYSNYKPDNNVKAVVILGTGMFPLSTLDSGCIARDVSQSGAKLPFQFSNSVLKGRIIVGYSNTQNQYAGKLPGAQAVYWDAWDHIVPLPLPILLPNDSVVISSEAVSISDDGKIIGGNLYYNQKADPTHYMSYPCVWRFNPFNPPGSHYSLLGVLNDLPGGDNYALIRHISGNGKVIAGNGSTFTGDPSCYNYQTTACKWNLIQQGNGTITCDQPVALSSLTGYTGTSASGTNFNGSVIVGTSYNITGTCGNEYFEDKPLRWNANNISQLPEDISVTVANNIPPGWILYEAIRVSADGNTIIGYGFDYDYNVIGWVAGLPPMSGLRTVFDTNASRLEQNIPNPFKENTTVTYYISKSANRAILKLFSMDGNELKSFSIASKGKGQIEIAGNTLSPGVYTYMLLIDGQSIDTKQMILTK